MKKLLVFCTVVVVLLGMISAASAAGIRERIRDQQKRINQGITSGELTRNEADTVQDNLNWIKFEFARITDDGRVTPAETNRIDAMLDRNNRMIVDRKHNPVAAFYEKKFKVGEIIHERIQSQQARIKQGMDSRELTPKEADILRDNLNSIRDELQRLKRDGRLTWLETERLNRMLDRNSEIIFAKKHNRNAPVERLNFKLFIDLN